MKKVVTIIFSVLLILSITIMFAGCGDADKLVGSWETEMDFTNLVKESMIDEDEELAEYLEIIDVKLKFIYEFGENGTYKTYLEEETFNDTVKNLRRNYTLGVKKYFEELIENQALNMTVDEVLAKSNTSLEALVDEVLGEKAVNEWKKAAAKEGYFKAKAGKLYISDGLDYSVDREEYETYELSGDTLKILGSVKNNTDEENIDFDIYPMVLKKIGD